MGPSGKKTQNVQERAKRELDTRRSQRAQDIESRRMQSSAPGRKNPDVPAKRGLSSDNPNASEAAVVTAAKPPTKKAKSAIGKQTVTPAGGRVLRRAPAVEEDDTDEHPHPLSQVDPAGKNSKTAGVKVDANLGKRSQPAKTNARVVVSDDELANSDGEPEQPDSEGEEGPGDDDEDMQNLTEAELAALINGEQAVIAGDASDIWNIPEYDVEMVSRPSSRASSRMSVDGAALDEAENAETSAVRAPGGSGKRQQAFESELPEIKAAQPEGSEANEPKPMAPLRLWPKHARLVDKGARLQDQPDLLRLIVQTAIKRETFLILTSNSWPTIGLRAEYCQRFLLEAAQDHVAHFKLLDDVIKRLNADPEFARALGNIVLDRFSTTRSPVKVNATNQIAAYELSTGTKCKDRVEALIQDDCYIFPGEWVGVSGQRYDHKADSPYQHPAIIETLKASFFHTPSSIGFRAVKEYNDSLTNAPKRILPPSMVALAATGVFAALLEWETGRHKKEPRFEGNLYSAVYRSHHDFIEGIKDDKEAAYYGILSTLYELVTETDGTIVRKQTTRGLRGIMDLSKYT